MKFKDITFFIERKDNMFHFGVKWTPSKIDQIKFALKEGKKLKAIKIYKEWKNCNVRTAKYAIDKMSELYYRPPKY